MSINEIAAALAVEMTIITGEIWRTIPDTDEHNQRPQIFSPSAYLFIYLNWDKRLSISASTPRGMKTCKTAKSITCDPKRTPEAIARDITARLLPDAREYFAESKAYDHQQRKEEATNALIDKMLQKYLPHKWRNGGNEKFTNEYHKTANAPEVEACRNYENQIEIQVTLAIKPALELLKQLTKEN